MGHGKATTARNEAASAQKSSKLATYLVSSQLALRQPATRAQPLKPHSGTLLIHGHMRETHAQAYSAGAPAP